MTSASKSREATLCTRSCSTSASASDSLTIDHESSDVETLTDARRAGELGVLSGMSARGNGRVDTPLGPSGAVS